jgi:phosphonate transport system substrate-binding protein
MASPSLEGPALRLGLVPFLPEGMLREEWEPLRQYLERELQRPVKLVLTHSYSQMVDAICKKRVDVADLSAYPFLLAKRREPQIRMLALSISANQRTYESYFVVPKGLATRLSQLKDLRVCYVDRSSTSGYLMARAMVRGRGFDPDDFFSSHQFSGDHLRALQDLLANRCDVAAVASSSFRTAQLAGVDTDRLHIVAASEPIPQGVYCAAPGLPERLGKRIQRALLELDLRRELGRSMLSAQIPITGFTAPDPTAFDTLAREIKLADVGPSQ